MMKCLFDTLLLIGLFVLNAILPGKQGILVSIGFTMAWFVFGLGNKRDKENEYLRKENEYLRERYQASLKEIREWRTLLDACRQKI